MTPVVEDMDTARDMVIARDDMAPDAAPDLVVMPDLAPDMTPVADMAPPQDMSTADGIPARPWDITQRGPYNVGHMTTQFSYTVQPSGSSRSIKVSMWHPTLQEEGPKARYLNGIVSSSGAFRGATIPQSPGRFPLLVFSHGNGSFPALRQPRLGGHRPGAHEEQRL